MTELLLHWDLCLVAPDGQILCEMGCPVLDAKADREAVERADELLRIKVRRRYEP